MTSTTVTTTDISRAFGGVNAVDRVSFAVAAGEIFGLIGPDGAGKTTLFRILTTLLKPDSGSATVLGLDVVRDLWKLRPLLGYMPGRFSLYPDLTALENLSFYASVFGTTVAAQQEMIAPIWGQLERFADRRAAALSGGMKQKLALCCALVHRPQLLLLDEPTTGVDVVSRKEFWDLLGTLRATGLPIMVSTPYMDEAIRCDRIALMQGGKLLSIGTPQALSSAFPLPLFAVRSLARHQLLGILRAFPHAASVWPFGEAMHYADNRTDLATAQIMAELSAWCVANGAPDARVEAIPATVEDAFIQLMSSAAA